MKITPEDFMRLIDQVEKQGGAHLNATCTSDGIAYKMPDGQEKLILTTGCKEPLLFKIPYDPSETVMVPEPLLEADPNRSEWTDANGDSRVTRRSKTETLPTGAKRVLTEVVERSGQPNEGFLNSVTVCASDDNVAMWPRFAKGAAE
jgi:hypothetical protein